MSYVSVIDVSSFIWNKKDFDQHADRYYDLALKLPILYDQLISNECVLLMRNNLIYEIFQHFPYHTIPRLFSDFEETTLSFLAKVCGKTIQYPGEDDVSIESIPNMIKDHYEQTTTQEVRYLISRIHNVQEPKTVMFTFEYLWKNDSKLKTKTEVVNYDYETVISDNIDTVVNYFKQLKKKFEHNPKHDKYKAGDYESSLSCYNERTKDVSEAQKLLDNSISHGDSFYNFDMKNNVWVVFRRHENNKYHGFNQQNRERIPNEIRNKISK